MLIRLLHTRRLPLNARRPGLIRKAVRLGLGGHAKRRGELNVVFVLDREIRRLNKTHLGHDRATDVIAFPYSQKVQGMRSMGRVRDLPFGDIVISVDRAMAQAKEWGHPLLKEILTLAAHGALHLIGYRDRRPAERARMFKKQDAILRHCLPISWRRRKTR